MSAYVNTTDFGKLDDFPKEQLHALYAAFKTSGKVCTDSRKLKAGEIFVALKGGNFDGNRFALKALEIGASLVVIDDRQLWEEASETQRSRLLLVEKGLTALQALAREHRRHLKAPVFAITGSNGKTTTKELLAAVLSSTYRTSATKGNFNNHIGVPLTLLEIDADCEFAIIEMGANHQGEIAGLCAIAEPDFGLITNIGSAHLEGFGGPEGVKKGKGELYAYLKASEGLIFRYSGQEELADLAGDYPHQITYGFNAATDFICGSEIPGALFASLELNFEGSAEHPLALETKLVGSYNLPNILAAVCVGLHQGIALAQVQEALENYTPANNRSQLLEKNGWQVVMDAYNANPTSTLAAITHFETIETGRAKVAILGDMLELGDHEQTAHEAIAQRALEAVSIEKLVLVGPAFGRLDISKLKAAHDRVLQFPDAETAREWLATLDARKFTFLLKGSRGIGLERMLPEI